jgi:hypothetical protein
MAKPCLWHIIASVILCLGCYYPSYTMQRKRTATVEPVGTEMVPIVRFTQSRAENYSNDDNNNESYADFQQSYAHSESDFIRSQVALLKFRQENLSDDDYLLEGDTLLHYTIRKGYNGLAQELIEYAKNRERMDELDTKNNDKETPMSIAQRNNNTYIISLLEEALGRRQEDSSTAQTGVASVQAIPVLSAHYGNLLQGLPNNNTIEPKPNADREQSAELKNSERKLEYSSTAQTGVASVQATPVLSAHYGNLPQDLPNNNTIEPKPNADQKQSAVVENTQQMSNNVRPNNYSLYLIANISIMSIIIALLINYNQEESRDNQC